MGDMKESKPQLILDILGSKDSQGSYYNTYTSGNWDTAAKRIGIIIRCSSQLDFMINSMYPTKIATISSAITDWTGTSEDDTQILLYNKYYRLLDKYIISWYEYYYSRPSGLVNYRLDEIYDEGQEEMNHRPYIPSNLHPRDIGGVGINDDISWDGGDPDPGDSVTYYVYFGLYTNPELLKTQTATTCDVGTMANLKTYHWKIMSVDSYGKSSQSEIVSFITEP